MTQPPRLPVKLILYDADQWGSACPVLRVVGPAQAAGMDVLSGATWSEGVLRGYTTVDVASAELVIIQRDFPRHHEAYAAVLAAARAHHKPVLYEQDDLLLEVPENHPSNGYYVDARIPILAAIAEADGVTASTPALADYLRSFNPRVWVLPNYLNDQIWRLRPPQRSAPEDPVVIGFVGGHTHTADVALITPVLIKLLGRYGDRLRLKFWGAAPPSELANLRQVTWNKLSILDYGRYVNYLQQQAFDICLAPLTDSHFNRCKSAIKYLEYSALGVPGVYSRLEPYAQVVQDGANGLLAESEAEWEAALTRLIDDAHLRLQVAQRAQATVRDGWQLSQHAAAWRQVYQAVQAGAPGASAASPQANAARKALAWQRGLVTQLQAAEGLAQTQQAHLARLQVERDELAGQAAQLQEIISSPTWGLMQWVMSTRRRVVPKGSRGERMLDLAVLAFRLWRQAGTRAALSQTAQAFRHLLPAAAHRMGARLVGRRDPYQAWIKAHEPSRAELARQRRMAQPAGSPRISVITPVYNPAPAVLADTIASVRGQTYANWELCLADGHSSGSEVREVLGAATRAESRIRLKLLERNLGIAGNLNEALALATGEYVLLLDHDDLLAPDALWSVARVVADDPSLDIVYFDEDKISGDGRTRLAPWFKPSAWSPDLLLSTNVFLHSVVRRRLLLELGGFDSGLDGAQDWDMALRLSHCTRRIVHIPRILYHWRQVPGSAARDANAKPWAFAAQERLITAHMRRLGIAAPRMSFQGLGRVRVEWPTSGALVSIIIPTKDKLELLRPCLDSIFARTTYTNYEIVLVDTGSIRPETWRYYAQLKAEQDRVRVVHLAAEFNYSAANNLGASQSTGDLLLFLNNDVETLEPSWLAELVGWVERPEVGIVGCKLLRPNGTIQHAGLIMGLAGHGSHAFDGSQEDTFGPFGSSEWYRDYQAVTGACLIVRRAVFEALGGFDEAYQIGYSDIELCLRAGRHGYRVVYTPFARLLHREGGSRALYNPPADVLRAYQQMLPLVEAGDPYFSPNLSYAQRQPTIAAPGEPKRTARLEQVLADHELLAAVNQLTRSAPAQVPEPFRITAGADPPARRVLLVTHELSQSGAPLVLSKLARHLQQSGYATALLAPVDGPLRTTFEQAGIEVQVDPVALTDARAVAARLRGFGLLLANTVLSWRAIYAARAAQVPSIWWIHEARFGQNLARRVPGLAKAFSAAGLVIFPSIANARLYAQYVRPEQQVVLPTGIEWPVLDANSPFAERAPGKLLVVSIASLEPRKGQDVLFDALAALPPGLIEQIELVLVGQILDRRYYRRLVQKSRQYPHIRILGPVAHSTALAYLQAADLFVLASRDEVMPVALLEAMALGKGIVATSVGGIPEAVDHGAHGWLVPADDPAALAQGLARMLQDAELRARLGAAARDRCAAGYTLRRFGDAVVELVQRLVEARQVRTANAVLGGREVLGESPELYRPPPSFERR